MEAHQICPWCGGKIEPGTPADDPESPSHGICPGCFEQLTGHAPPPAMPPRKGSRKTLAALPAAFVMAVLLAGCGSARYTADKHGTFSIGQARCVRVTDTHSRNRELAVCGVNNGQGGPFAPQKVNGTVQTCWTNDGGSWVPLANQPECDRLIHAVG
jgi:hypothetical protein